MSKTKKNYRVNDSKKVVSADIPALTEEELKVVKNFMALGYTLKHKQKSKSPTVEEMRAILKENDEAAYNEFEKLYKMKADKNSKNEEDRKAGFHRAMKFYGDWAKEHKKD